MSARDRPEQGDRRGLTSLGETVSTSSDSSSSLVSQRLVPRDLHTRETQAELRGRKPCFCHHGNRSPAEKPLYTSSETSYVSHFHTGELKRTSDFSSKTPHFSCAADGSTGTDSPALPVGAEQPLRPQTVLMFLHVQDFAVHLLQTHSGQKPSEPGQGSPRVTA